MDAYAALNDRVLVVRDVEGDPTASERLLGHSFECIEATPARPERIFAGTVDAGLLRSTDGGKTWEEVGEFDDRVTAVTSSPHDDEVVWAGTEPSAVYRSDNGGETWTHPQEGLEHRYVWGLAVDAADPDTVVVSAASGARTAHRTATADAHVYRRTNGVWEHAMEGLPEPSGMVRAVLDSGHSAGEFVAVTNRGVFVTTNGAQSWEAVAIDWPEEYETQVGRGLAVV